MPGNFPKKPPIDRVHRLKNKEVVTHGDGLYTLLTLDEAKICLRGFLAWQEVDNEVNDRYEVPDVLPTLLKYIDKKPEPESDSTYICVALTRKPQLIRIGGVLKRSVHMPYMAIAVQKAKDNDGKDIVAQAYITRLLFIAEHAHEPFLSAKKDAKNLHRAIWRLLQPEEGILQGPTDGSKKYMRNVIREMPEWKEVEDYEDSPDQVHMFNRTEFRTIPNPGTFEDKDDNEEWTGPVTKDIDMFVIEFNERFEGADMAFSTLKPLDKSKREWNRQLDVYLELFAEEQRKNWREILRSHKTPERFREMQEVYTPRKEPEEKPTLDAEKISPLPFPNLKTFPDLRNLINEITETVGNSKKSWGPEDTIEVDENKIVVKTGHLHIEIRIEGNKFSSMVTDGNETYTRNDAAADENKKQATLSKFSMTSTRGVVSGGLAQRVLCSIFKYLSETLGNGAIFEVNGATFTDIDYNPIYDRLGIDYELPINDRSRIVYAPLRRIVEMCEGNFQDPSSAPSFSDSPMPRRLDLDA